MIVIGWLAVLTAPDRIKVDKLADMPPHSYAIATKPSELMLDHAAVVALAASIEHDIDGDLATHDIADKTLLKTLYRTLAAFAWYRGDAVAARRNSAKVGALEDKPAEKIMNGVQMLAWLDAEPGAEFHQRFRAELAARLQAMPWNLVQDDVRHHKAQAEILSRNLVLGSAEANLDPAAANHTLSQPLATAIVASALALEKIVPMKDDLVAVLRGMLDAHQAERKADIWGERDVTISGELTPVTIAIWDSGTDLSLFPRQIWSGSDKAHGLAWTLHSDKTTGMLGALVGDKAELDDAKAELQGFDDLGANVDSTEAAALKTKLGQLPKEHVKSFIENLTQYGQYAHGTHVAGIAARGNPAARLMVARITFDYHLTPETPTLAQAQKDARAGVQTVEYFSRNRVRAVNVSWGSALLEVDSALEKNHAGGGPEERRALAKQIFAIGYDALKQALSKAKDTLFVVAAGNSDNDVKFDEDMPSSFHLPNVLVVCAVDQAGEQTRFTSFGNIDVCANGYEVDSVIPGGAHLRFSGTSMAAPQVTNLAAKLWALHPALTVAQVRALIIRGSDERRVGDKIIRLINPKSSITLAAE